MRQSIHIAVRCQPHHIGVHGEQVKTAAGETEEEVRGPRLQRDECRGFI